MLWNDFYLIYNGVHFEKTVIIIIIVEILFHLTGIGFLGFTSSLFLMYTVTPQPNMLLLILLLSLYWSLPSHSICKSKWGSRTCCHV